MNSKYCHHKTQPNPSFNNFETHYIHQFKKNKRCWIGLNQIYHVNGLNEITYTPT